MKAVTTGTSDLRRAVENYGRDPRPEHFASLAQALRRLSRAARDAVEEEGASLPLPDIQGRVVVHWDD